VGGVELDETVIRGLMVLQFDHREVVYSLARLAGFPQDHINIAGLDNSEKDMLAIVPFKGLVIEQREKVGEVQFLNLQGLQELVPTIEKIEKNETSNGFLDADGWIALQLTATHFFDAELVATEKADVFFSAYSGVLQYGYSQFDGNFHEWERTRETINLKRQNYVLLVMLHSGGTWSRDLAPYKPTQSTLKSTISLDMQTIMEAGENFQLPLLLWNRFRESEDYYMVAIGLSQVFESLSSGIKLPKRFTKAQLKDLVVRTGANLTEQERELVQEAINKLNERALREKFEKHLQNIGLVLSKDEQELLGKFREIRNDIEHGRKPQEPSLPEIKRVKALVNRVILTSLATSRMSSDAN
jgi:hypothetical protein